MSATEISPGPHVPVIGWQVELGAGSMSLSGDLAAVPGLAGLGVVRLDDLREIVVDRDLDRLTSGIERAGLSGRPFSVRLHFRQGSLAADVHGIPEAGEDGRTKAVRGLMLVEADEGREAADPIAGMVTERVRWLFDQAQEIASLGAWELDVATGRTLWTRQVYAIHELEPGTDQNVATGVSYYCDEGRPAIERALSEAVESQKSFDVTCRFRTAKGNLRWVRSCGHPVVREGQVVRLVGVFQDVTTIMDAEASMRETYGLLAKLSAQVPGFLYQYRRAPDGRESVPFLSSGVRELLGIGAAELCANPVRAFALLHPDDRAMVRRAVATSAQTLEPLTVECRITPQPGEVRWIRGEGMPERLDDGSIVWHGFTSDITERKETENELRHRQLILEHAERIANAGSWELDLTDELFRVSDGWKAIHGVTGAAPRTWADLVPFAHVEDLPMITERWKQTLSGTGNYDFDHRIVRESDGVVRWVHACGEVERDADGKPTRFFGVCRDVTARREVDQQLVRAKEAAEAADRAKSEFLAMMSHEIRTPMNAVIGFCDVLGRSDLLDEQREYVQLIQSAGTHLVEIIDGILDYAKLEVGRMELKCEAFSPAVTISRLCQLLAPTALARGLGFETRIAPDVPAGMMGDPFAIRRIVLNLVGNAVKFTERGRVDVDVSVEGDDGVEWLVVVVRDTGVGLSDAALARLFQPFTQGDSSDSRRFGGTGLGLAITARLAEAMGGGLTAERQGGGGSRFVFRCPVERAENVEATDGGVAAAEAANVTLDQVQRGLRVLLAEDNRVNQKLVSILLSRLGCHCRAVDNGRLVLEVLENETFDVVLMDVQMPELDGLETTAEIRRRERANGESSHQHIIALTAYALPTDAERCLAAGMDAHVPKPITLSALATALAGIRF